MDNEEYKHKMDEQTELLRKNAHLYASSIIGRHNKHKRSKWPEYIIAFIIAFIIGLIIGSFI